MAEQQSDDTLRPPTPSQAEGNEGGQQSSAPTPQTPSQAEGSREAADTALEEEANEG